MLMLGLMAALWGFGWAFGLPSRLRVQGVILLWAAAILAHLALPEDSPLRQTIGGSAA